MDNLDLVLCLDEIKWDNFINVSPQGSIYCKSDFLKCLPAKIDKYFFYSNGKEIASVILINNEESPLFSMYQGVCLAPISGGKHHYFNEQLKTLTLLLECLVKVFPTLELSLSHHFEDLRAFQWINYNEPHKGQFSLNLNYTGIIPLKEENNFESYLTSIRSVRRYEWRQCEKKGFRVFDSSDIMEFIKLYKLTFERQGIILDSNSINTVTSITKSAISNNFGRLVFCADNDGVVHSANLILFHNDTCYYEFGASDPQFRSSGASVYLMLNNIKYAIENGYSFFDLVGINSPNRGDFKLSFNAFPKAYFVAKGSFNM